MFEITIPTPQSSTHNQDQGKLNVLSLNLDETVAAQNLFDLLNWKPKKDNENHEAIAGLIAIQNSLPPSSLQFVIQDYHVKGPMDPPYSPYNHQSVARWYKDEGRKEESNIEFLVLVRDLKGNKITLSQPVSRFLSRN